MIITEKDAALAYAKTWNRLNYLEFLELLADDAHYTSQMVLDELQSKDEISDYFINKIETVRATSGEEVYAELCS